MNINTKSDSQKNIFNEILKKYSDLIKKLFDSMDILSQGGKPEPSVQSTVNDIIKVDENLQKALNGLEEHQYLQKKIEIAQKTSEEYNIALLSLIRKLKSAEIELESVLSKAKIKLKALKSANKGKIDYKELVSYSQRIAPYTSAPQGWNDTDGFVNIPNRPPIPEESMFRASELYQSHGKPIEDTFDNMDNTESMMMEDSKINMGMHLSLEPVQEDMQDSLLDLDLDL